MVLQRLHLRLKLATPRDLKGYGELGSSVSWFGGIFTTLAVVPRLGLPVAAILTGLVLLGHNIPHSR